MTCPACQHRKSRVVDTRAGRRRHECQSCRVRFSTLEQILPDTIRAKKSTAPVQKKSGSWLEGINAKLAESPLTSA